MTRWTHPGWPPSASRSVFCHWQSSVLYSGLETPVRMMFWLVACMASAVATASTAFQPVSGSQEKRLARSGLLDRMAVPQLPWTKSSEAALP